MLNYDPDHPTPAQRLLARLLAANSADGPDLGPQFAALGTDQVVAAAVRHHVAGLFLQACHSLGLELSGGQQDLLRKQATQIAAINIGTLRALGPLAEALEQAGFPFMLLKGAALNLLLYDRPDLRMMTDIDVLVRSEHAAEVQGLLLDRGYQAGRDLVTADFYPRYYYQREYVPADGSLLRLDVHVRPFRPLRMMQVVPDDGMWQGTQCADLHGSQVEVPGDDNMLIHMAAHSAVHGDERLLWLYDIMRFVRDRGEFIDWNVFNRRVERWRLCLAVKRTLVRCGDLFDHADLKECASRVPRRGSWKDRLVLHHSPRDAGRPVMHVLTNLLTTSGLSFKLGYLAAVLFPDRVHMGEVYRRRHPGWLLCAHLWRGLRALIRPLRLTS